MAQIASKRICLTGPESTGKSQLAAILKRELHAPVAGEYAREYAETHGNDLTAGDVEPIARGEMANLGRALAEAAEYVLFDTDLLSTVVYARHYYGACPAWIEEEARRRLADLYLLLDTDVAWKPDPARDNSPDDREDLFDAFRRTLDEFGARWVVVSGEWDVRLASARDAIARL